jgi:hypothetical protein
MTEDVLALQMLDSDDDSVLGGCVSGISCTSGVSCASAVSQS